VRHALKIAPNDPDWETTAAGRPFSYKYGYGSLDAFQFVTAAQNWKLVKPQAWVDLGQVAVGAPSANLTAWNALQGGTFIAPAGGVKSAVKVTKGMLDGNNFDKLEHITVKVWIAHTKRGDVEVEIVSPKGVKSILAAQRKWDEDKTGFPGWRFMSVKHWCVCLTDGHIFTLIDE
jgi:kexin